MKIAKPLILAATLIVATLGLPAGTSASPRPPAAVKLRPEDAARYRAWVTHARHVYLYRLMAAHHKAELARAEARRRAEAARPKPGPGGLIMGRRSCGGDLPPCYVMMRESKGYINIWNGGCSYPCGSSSASGKWQAIRSSWGGYGGYRNAADAPESVQDAWARRLWRGGSGCSHWSACR